MGNTIIIKDKEALVEFQCIKWSYFVKKIIGVGKNLTDTESNENENKIVQGLIKKL